MSGPVSNEKEAIEGVKTLLTGWLTQGKKVRDFEKAFAKYMGAREGIAVNSGSSANLVAISTLATSDRPENERIGPGDEVITPALTWPTTAYPIIQVGATGFRGCGP